MFEYKLANLGALVLGIIFSFNTQGRFVFDNIDKRLFIRFACCWFLIYSFNIFLIGQFMSLGFDAYISGALALPEIVVFSYLIQKYLVFKKPRKLTQAMTP